MRDAYRSVTIVGSLDRVRIVVDRQVVAEHVRDLEAKYDPNM